MLNSVRRVLYRSFSAASQPSAGISEKELLRETNLQNLVEKFKILCQDRTFRGRKHVYQHIIRRLAYTGHFNLIEEILEDQKKYIPISSTGFAARLITLYGKSGMFDHARKLFDEMPERTLLAYNALIGACLNSKNFDELKRLFTELPEKLCIELDVVSYNTIIKAYCEMGSLDEAALMLDEMEKKGNKPDFFSYNTLLNACYKNGRLGKGEEIWNRMLEKNVAPDVRSYNAKLLGLVKYKRVPEAIELFRDLRRAGLKPDALIFNVLIGYYVEQGNLIRAKNWYHQMGKHGCPPDKVTFDLLIPFSCEKGEMDFAFELCERVLCRNFVRKFFFPDASLLQRVVDELVKCSRIEEARKLVQLGKSNEYHQYELKLPSL